MGLKSVTLSVGTTSSPEGIAFRRVYGLFNEGALMRAVSALTFVESMVLASVGSMVLTFVGSMDYSIQGHRDYLTTMFSVIYPEP